MSQDLKVGSLLRHFRILERLKAGGMGIVYRAFDEHMNREVAIKVLPPEFSKNPEWLAQIQNEARALARFSHPNIATVYEFGIEPDLSFLVMEYLTGDPLDAVVQSGPLPERRVLELGVRMLDGLAAAHAQRVIHRDLKPANLRFAADGTLKILDFGLAKTLDRDADVEMTQPPAAEHRPGTLPYMAPEQYVGGEVGPRSDLWAVGLILYELATRRRFYDQRETTALVHAILNTPAEIPRDVRGRMSKGLQKVILRALQKNSDNRHASAIAFQRQLRSLQSPGIKAWWTGLSPLTRVGITALAAIALLWPVSRNVFPPAPPATIQTRLAIMPFTYRGDPDREAYGLGIPEVLTERLDGLSPGKLSVYGPATTHVFGAEDRDQVRKTLGATHMLGGLIVRLGDRLRVSAHLTRVADGATVWSDSYDRTVSQAFTIQSDIAREVVKELQIVLLPGIRRPASPRSADEGAYDAFLLGVGHLRDRSEPALRMAVEQLSLSVSRDPTFAAAYARLADAYLLLADFGFEPGQRMMPLAGEAAAHALSLDSTLAEARVASATVRQDFNWDWDGAEQEFQAAIRLDSNSPLAHERYADLLVALDSPDHALRELETALSLGPYSIPVMTDLAVCRLYRGETSEALAVLRRALELERNSPDIWNLVGEVYWSHGEADSALVNFAMAMNLSGATDDEIRDLGRAYNSGGRQGVWEWRLHRLEASAKGGYVSPYDFARVYANLGRDEDALRWLERACAERVGAVTGVGVDPAFRRLRTAPRFIAILHRMGLSSYLLQG